VTWIVPWTLREPLQGGHVVDSVSRWFGVPQGSRPPSMARAAEGLRPLPVHQGKHGPPAEACLDVTALSDCTNALLRSVRGHCRVSLPYASAKTRTAATLLAHDAGAAHLSAKSCRVMRQAISCIALSGRSSIVVHAKVLRHDATVVGKSLTKLTNRVEQGLHINFS